jgi:hypothetical protein
MFDMILYLKFKKDRKAFIVFNGLFSYIRDHDIVLTKVFWTVIYRRCGNRVEWF